MLNNCNEFACCKAIAILFVYRSRRSEDRAQRYKTTNSLVCLTNNILSGEFPSLFFKVNNYKPMDNHKSGTTEKHFWIIVVDAYVCNMSFNNILDSLDGNDS